MLLRLVQAIILGIVQGATEFVPVSSSAHLIIIPWLFGWTDPALRSLSFHVGLHIGTLIAVLSFFASDWLRLVRAGVASLVERKIGDDPDRKLAWLVVLGTIPGGIAGVLGESKIEALFHAPGVPPRPPALVLMAGVIAVLGVALFLAERMARHTRQMNLLTLKDTVVIGLAQALAIFPGVSRSGSTITAGLAMGLERDSAARFSFLLSAPIIAGAGAKSLWEVLSEQRSGAITSGDLPIFFVGAIAAALSGYLFIGFLLRYLQRKTANVFVYYRWSLAAFIVLMALVRG